ncbi:UDP-N-acetylglucosamine 2-epimerase (non-hydrolyzing) [Flammeovirga sp. SubArs3]|uniref:non-hydrolyzing UDP-N-acetylglucosamine 2-epimerase n=1 Tax=Flammeovirga sp. SubArs3 TaxID=2995316 RepID=UPI00248B57AC|nr:UDP-N-acetylglucosamine 2-epimerase (non-hydrolyzing) [Flammeovirga sp. SubArs3]
MKKIFLLIGTRPNFIKVTRFKTLAKAYNMDVKIIHTGQHYDVNMSKVFFDQFNLEIDYYLGIGQLTPAAQVAQIILKLEELFERKGQPDILIVPGDVNSTMAGAIAAKKLGIKLGHLESGLRSDDHNMPEEHNRIITDNISDICFVTEDSGIRNLKKDGVDAALHYVGNTMIDTLVHYEKDIDASTILSELGVKKDEFYLCTFHRPSNVDFGRNINKLYQLLNMLTEKRKVVLPLHPRTMNNLKKSGLLDKFKAIPHLIITHPLGYFEFQSLIKNAKAVLTDSGGVQEETTFRKVPCLTVRENTERPVTITEGTNTLVNFDMEEISEYLKQIEEGTYKSGQIPKLWDGKATERILEILAQ